MKKIIYIFIFGIFIYVGYKFFEQRFYIKQLKKDSIHLKESIQDFHWNFFGLYPENKSDIIRTLKWSNEVNTIPVEIESFKNGFNVYFDKKLNKFILYSYGKDRRDNKSSLTPLNNSELDSTGQFEIRRINIFKYIYYSFKQYDVILDLTNIPELNCEYLLNNTEIEPHYELFLKNTPNTEKESKYRLFIKYLHVFEREHSNLQKTGDLKSYFMYKNDSLKLMCSNQSIEKKDLEILKKSLILFFKENNINFFDYSLFPIVLKSAKN